MRYFLAGGAVRDILLGRTPTEFDIVFDGTPEDMVRQHGELRQIGKTAVTYLVNGRDHTPLLGSITENLLARDFTINALLLDENGIIHALPQTFADMRDGILRHASPQAFLNDPARIFRLARLTATLPGFSICPETMRLMQKAAEGEAIHALSAERVGKECMKAMAGHSPGNFLHVLSLASALSPWFSPWEKGESVPAGPALYHGDNSVLDHTRIVMDKLATMPLSLNDRPLAVWMGLCHDLGKLTTLPERLPRHIGHESRGKALAQKLARLLRLPRRWEKAGCLAALLHMKAGQYHLLRPATKVDLLHTLAVSRLASPFIALVVADSGNAALYGQMTQDMQTILAVTLPEQWRGKGTVSGEVLRHLRIVALQSSTGSGQKLHP